MPDALRVDKKPRRRTVLRWTERVFWVTGILFLASYAYVYLDRTAHQAYQEWQFERSLKNESSPLVGFLLHWLKIAKETPAPPESQDSTATLMTSKGRKGSKRALKDGEVIGRIEIHRLGVKAMVLESTTDETLRRAVGHIEGTPLPGEPGNVGLAGHRDTFFRGLRDIRKDDTIQLITLDGPYQYQVESIRIVQPYDTYVLNNTGVDSLTLVTCYPFNYVGTAPERFIVHARAVKRGPSEGS
jgi:sortase A